MTPFGKYVARGKLKRQAPDFRQVHQQLARSRKGLKTFEAVVATDSEWAAAIAYQAILRAGRALLFACGYLPADGAQHKTVVELTDEILGREFRGSVEQFERLRRKRNVFFYDSGEAFSDKEAATSLDVAARLLSGIERKVAARPRRPRRLSAT